MDGQVQGLAEIVEDAGRSGGTLDDRHMRAQALPIEIRLEGPGRREGDVELDRFPALAEESDRRRADSLAVSGRYQRRPGCVYLCARDQDVDVVGSVQRGLGPRGVAASGALEERELDPGAAQE